LLSLDTSLVAGEATAHFNPRWDELVLTVLGQGKPLGVDIIVALPL